MKKLLLLAFCLLAFPAFGQTLASPGGGSSATFPTICPAPVASGQILYDNAGACGGITGWTTNGTTTITGAASTTLAIGGATIGTNALAVTGTVLFSNGATVDANGVFTGSSAGAGGGFRVNSSGSTAGITIGWPGGAGDSIKLQSSGSYGFTATNAAAAADLTLFRDAANTLAQRNGVNAQTFNLYETFTDTSNYSRLSSSYVSGNTRFEVATAAAGTGTLRAIQYNAGASGGAITLSPSGSTNVISLGISGVSNYWSLTNAGNLITTQDNTTDIGASGATRPRIVYAGTNMVSPSVNGTTNMAIGSGVSSILLSNPTASYLLLQNASLAAAGVQFGGTTASFPALKRVTTTLGVRLADDSADAGITMSTIVASGITQITNATDSTTTTSGSLQVAGGAAIIKRVFIPGITASAGLQTAVLCQSSGGEMIADSVACLASSARFKNLAGPMEDGALFKLAALPMRRWNYKPEGIFHNDVEHVGPIAEDVAAMDRRLAGYDKDGKVRTYSTEQLLAYTIKALQELKAGNDNLRQEMMRIAR